MEWIDWDEKYVWHPFTQAQTEKNPLPIVRGEDAFLFDANGKKYLDANSSWWVNVHGHGHPALKTAISEQLEKLQHVIFAGIAHEPAARLSKDLLKWLPNDFQKAFFSDNGSTSTEVAIKMALQFWFNKGQNRRKVIAIEGAYHGDTFGAMSVSERDVFNRPFEALLFDVEFIPFPEKGREEEVLNRIGELVKGGEIAAFIFEPLVQGASGMRMYSTSFLERAIQFCQSQEVLCIADEVMTGFGRTGKMFAIDHLNVNPDIICLSKGLTGGYLPMGLTITGMKLYNAFLSDKKQDGFLHETFVYWKPISLCSSQCQSRAFR